eukprot:TRINITY_DN15809_c0_g1_i5.p2 TRINITY_DN15809_c0_g1~~TRINITY_DN15809_c0_g1_i5.p2  ORF type:complete len:248 (+),score=66.94 TRINITY_DN15809_c0_g1_i5:454-1197(+)
MHCPVERGAPSDWDEYEKLWDHALRTELNVNPEDVALVLTDAPQNVQTAMEQGKIRRRMAEIAFETFGVCALTMGMQPVLSLFSTGRTRGCVVEVGAGVSSVVPVFEGLALKHAIMRQNVAGSDITRALLTSLNLRKLPGLAKNDMIEANIIKEKVCYVCMDMNAEQTKLESNPQAMTRSYELPDATTISLDTDRWVCPEILFQPQLCGEEDGLGIHELCNKAISKATTPAWRDPVSQCHDPSQPAS